MPGPGVVFIEKLPDGMVLDVAKPGLAVLGEELSDRCAVGRLDLGVDVEKRPAEACGKQRSNRAFPGAHEAGQD